jgi:hypothetical protein
MGRPGGRVEMALVRVLFFSEMPHTRAAAGNHHKLKAPTALSTLVDRELARKKIQLRSSEGNYCKSAALHKDSAHWRYITRALGELSSKPFLITKMDNF